MRKGKWFVKSTTNCCRWEVVRRIYPSFKFFRYREIMGEQYERYGDFYDLQKAKDFCEHLNRKRERKKVINRFKRFFRQRFKI